jgi:5-(hydroxymethyl)furfural/furfural oxidase
MQEACDVAIVGGGAAGCILAARLSEDPARRVILVEAGQDTPPDEVPSDIRDTFPIAYFNPSYFWPGLKASGRVGGAQVPYSQPRVMGGGSSVMGMWALRGMPGDYDAWRDAGAAGWSWSDVLPSFNRLEHDLDFAGPFHGGEGPIPIRRHPPDTWPGFVTALAKASAKRQLPLRDDLNADFADGVFAVPVTNDAGGRVSSAMGYLTDAVRCRPNLEVVSGAHVTRVILENRRAVGVEVRRGTDIHVLRSREVILSSGGIHSPALLLRSGIGPAGDLHAIGISPHVDLPGVGRRLQNHCVVNLATILSPGARQSPVLRTYGVACARVSSNIAGAMPGDLHLQFIAKIGAYAHGDRIGMVGAALYAPVSRGGVTLLSPDPAATPKVDFRLLDDPLDRVRMDRIVELGLDLLDDPDVAATHGKIFAVLPSSLARRLNRPGRANRVASSVIATLLDAPPAIRRHVLRRVGHPIPSSGARSQQIDALLDFIMPVFHPTGTCSMGAGGDDAAVVDPRCRVRGVDGLRVVDASIMPIIPRGNTCIPTMMVAEHAAALIAAARDC